MILKPSQEKNKAYETNKYCDSFLQVRTPKSETGEWGNCGAGLPPRRDFASKSSAPEFNLSPNPLNGNVND